MLGKLALVGVELLLEVRYFALRLPFFELSELVLVLHFLLLMLVQKVLLLSLDDHGKLRLFAFHLLYKLLEVGYLFEVLNFLRGNFLVEGKLTFLASDDMLDTF